MAKGELFSSGLGLGEGNPIFFQMTDAAATPGYMVAVAHI